MLPVDGPIVAPRSVEPEAWAHALAGTEMPLVIAPASERGWFGGLAVIAWSPVFSAEGVALDEAAAMLERSLAADAPCLTAAFLPYDGSWTVATYAGGLIRTDDGWRVWGTLDAGSVPAIKPGTASALPPEAPLVRDARSDVTPTLYRAGVRSVIEAIHAGDVYVMNLTRRLAGRATTSPAVGFATLVARSEADMAAFWSTPGITVASVSPERFIRISGGCIEVCPIKGTRPRAAGDRDAAMALELASSEKERAEHVMIVDLERNDLGRVCQAGTVAVDPLFEVVATPYCHQMVSSVRGVLDPRASLGEVLASVFPCGSVTGAPKIAAVQRIAGLEASPRAAYTGSLVIAVPGELDSSVLIRTAEYVGGDVRWGTGAGITADSDPAEEWLETLLKASPLLGDALPAVALRETCRMVDGRVPLLPRHLARLAAGGCGPSVLMRVRAAVAEQTRVHPAGTRRLAVTVEPPASVEVRVSAAASALAVPGGPVILPVESPVSSLPPGGAKPADRGPWDEAQRRAREAGADLAVLTDASGRLIDGAVASVWVRVGTRLLTPPAPPAVDGVARGAVFDHAAECGVEASECELTLGQLEAADEVFLSNALGGIVPVRGRGGPVSVALRAAFERLFDAPR